MPETVASPREIVDRLHDEIAAQSPEHAALVAAFRAIPRRPGRGVQAPRPDRGRPSAARLRRLAVYSAVRLGGGSMKGAARRAGISRDFARQYEADFLGTLAGGGT